MCQPHLSDAALGLLRKAEMKDGRLSVPLRSASHRQKNRQVMELVVAGLLQPVELEGSAIGEQRIVYAVSRRPERAA